MVLLCTQIQNDLKTMVLIICYKHFNLQTIRNTTMISKIKHNLAIKLDSIGFIASTLCAIHCAVMPFIFIFLAFYGLQFFANPIFEFIFISLSVVIGVFTFSHGYFNHHRRLYPFLIFASGLIVIFTGHFLFHDHGHKGTISADEIILLVISPIGAIMVGLGHYFNRKYSKHNTKVCQH